MRSLILVGGGGHARSVIDVIESTKEYRITGIVDRAEKLGKEVLCYSVTASEEQINSLVGPEQNFLITVGQVESAKNRIKLDKLLKQAGGKLAQIVSPFSRVSAHAKIGEGSVIMHFALINTGAVLGRNVVVNTQAVVEHDVTIGNFCHISTGAILNGSVNIGNEVFIGSHSTVRQGIRIGNQVIVGAHSYVHEDIYEAGVYVGIPARRLQ